LGSFYALADGLVFPSRQGETWGLVINEALQFGLPVLVSDHAGCARDLVAPPARVPPGSAVFASDNPDALARALRVWLAAPRPLPPQQGLWAGSASPADLSATPSPAAPPLPHPGDLAGAVLRQVRRLGGR
jgi:glycosyltransferase involved in cell wall biosynthesis